MAGPRSRLGFAGGVVQRRVLTLTPNESRSSLIAPPFEPCRSDLVADTLLEIDGSVGEGGGQILRTALALALCLTQPVRVTAIRRARRNPGLAPQHVAAVRAAAQVGAAEVAGAVLGSDQVRFVPRRIVAGQHHFSIGTAGSATLLIQTVLPALLTASEPARLVVEGGTHNPLAPSFDFLERLACPGFYPAGGGRIELEVAPVPRLRPTDVLARGPIVELRAEALLSRLPRHIGERELKVLEDAFNLAPEQLRLTEVKAAGPGNTVSLFVRAKEVTEVFTGFGERGVPAERVAAGVVREARRYLAAGVPVGEHLADQLLVPFVLAGGGAFETLRPSRHTTTNIRIIEQFTDLPLAWECVRQDVWRVRVG
jgi:RNA 3'-terminal phosphate cyclase (ATP)